MRGSSFREPALSAFFILSGVPEPHQPNVAPDRSYWAQPIGPFWPSFPEVAHLNRPSQPLPGQLPPRCSASPAAGNRTVPQ